MSYFSSVSSKSKPRWRYDVFINFRGEDTRRSFVSHLYSALANSGVNVYLDDENLPKGQELKPELLHAIEGSQISIVVFSQNYIKSTWCLDELVYIMKCHSSRWQVVMPLFYDIVPSFLRDVQDISFEVIPEKDSDKHKVRLWKKALAQAANLAGWDVRNYRNENNVVKEVVGEVLKRLDKTYLSITNFPVGLESRVQHWIGFIRNQTRGTCILGIWGMGGIGKSTIAKSIYNEIRHEFEYKSFLANIREVWDRHRGPIDLQKQLLSDILKTEKMVHSIDWGKGMIDETLCTKKVLVVLDDVEKLEQINALGGNRDKIGPGSVIIITTRDARLLDELGVDDVHEVEKMNEIESLELFSWHAFRKANPTRDFFEVSTQVARYCSGLPLALEVLGSYLYKRKTLEWQSVLSKLEKIPNQKIQEKLKISYDGLTDDMEKGIFLDICFFFIGKDRAYVTEILNGCGLDAQIGITILIERSLIKVEKNNKLGMHDLLRDMGREIVRQSSLKEPEKRSRLWLQQEVLDVLREHTGTAAIEGLALKLETTSRVSFSAETFEGMKRLRILKVDHVKINGDYGHISKHLRWVYWRGFPLKYLPDNFYQGNTVAIDLRHSCLKQVWKEPLSQLLEKLKFLNLSHSKNLSKTPDFSKLPNLERLILKDCPSLCEVHHSIGDLINLRLLNLKDCKSLGNLPVIIYKLESLKTLILSGCSRIDKLEEDIVQMESLTTLLADNTSLKQVPFSIVRSKNIEYISLCGFEGLARDVFPSLIMSWMSPTRGIVSSIQSFGSTSTSIVSMDIQDNNLGNLLPMLGEFLKLRSICFECDSDFQLTQELRTILDDSCNVDFAELETTQALQSSENSMAFQLIGMGSYHQVIDMLISNSTSEGLATHVSGDFPLPGDNYPYWLAYTGEGHSVPFQVPNDSNFHMKGMILCVVYSSILQNMSTESITSFNIFNYTKCTIHIYMPTATMPFTDEDWQSVISNLGPGDNVEIFVSFGHGMNVKKTAVYLIYSLPITMETESSSESSNAVEMQPSSDVETEPLTEVEMKPSSETKKNIFRKFTKKMRACSCSNYNKCFHSY